MIKSADFVSKDNQYKNVFLRPVVGPSSYSRAASSFDHTQDFAAPIKNH